MTTDVLLVIGLIVLLVVAFGSLRTNTQVARLERKLNLVLKHAGIDVASAADQEVLTLLQANKANKKIEAIKVYREYTGASLAAAKEHVERLQQLPGRAG